LRKIFAVLFVINTTLLSADGYGVSNSLSDQKLENNKNSLSVKDMIIKKNHLVKSFFIKNSFIFLNNNSKNKFYSELDLLKENNTIFDYYVNESALMLFVSSATIKDIDIVESYVNKINKTTKTNQLNK